MLAFARSTELTLGYPTYFGYPEETALTARRAVLDQYLLLLERKRLLTPHIMVYSSAKIEWRDMTKHVVEHGKYILTFNQAYYPRVRRRFRTLQYGARVVYANRTERAMERAERIRLALGIPSKK